MTKHPMRVSVELDEANQILAGLECVEGMMPHEIDFVHVDPANHEEFREDRRVIEARIKKWERRVKRLEN